MARGLGLLIALLFVTGCTTTRVSTLWQDPAYTGGPFHKLLVAGVSDRPGVRRSFEDRFVAALETRGAAAVAAWRVLPDQAEPSQGTLLGAARKAGADGLLVTRLMGIREQTVYTPPTFSIGPGYYGAYGGSAGVVWSYGFGAGYYSTYTNVFLEINLYDVRSERLVWSGQSKTFDPADVKQIVEEVPPKVVEALGQAGLLPAPSPGNRPRQVSRSASRAASRSSWSDGDPPDRDPCAVREISGRLQRAGVGLSGGPAPASGRQPLSAPYPPLASALPAPS